MPAPVSLDLLLKQLARLPSVGPRSARRMALHLLHKKDSLMLPLAATLQAVAQTVESCQVCGNWDTQNPCHLCTDGRRDKTILAVVENVADLWAMERAQRFRGLYHVLGGTLSALSDVAPEALRIPSLVDRCRQGGIEEVILALNATIDGQTTAHYVAAALEGLPVRLTRLAQGVPIGGELDYLDEGTLGAALMARLPL